MDTNTNTTREALGEQVRGARRNETDARLRAQRLEREAAAAVQDWRRSTAVRVRAELYFEMDETRERYAKLEARAARVSLANPHGQDREES